jgi:hypothetical protein
MPLVKNKPSQKRRQAYIAHYCAKGGSNPPYFIGSFRQPGYGLGNLFSGIARYAIPFLKNNVVPILKKGGKSFLKTSGQVIKDVILDDHPLKQAIVSRGKQKLRQILGENNNETEPSRKKRKRQAPSKKK